MLCLCFSFTGKRVSKTPSLQKYKFTDRNQRQLNRMVQFNNKQKKLLMSDKWWKICILKSTFAKVSKLNVWSTSSLSCLNVRGPTPSPHSFLALPFYRNKGTEMTETMIWNKWSVKHNRHMPEFSEVLVSLQSIINNLFPFVSLVSHRRKWLHAKTQCLRRFVACRVWYLIKLAISNCGKKLI